MKKILSLFDGISVAQQALKELDIECEYYASEIDKYSIQITQKNFPNTIQLGDVKNINYKGIEQFGFEFDLLIGGSPCQDLSIAKKNREGLKGSRSGLFYEYVRILKEVKPKYFILENVNSMPREAKETITQELFGIEPVMINAALVSAQNRKRLFWVGKLVNDTYERVEIELPQDRGILLKDILESNVDEKYNVNINNKYGEKGLCIDKGKSLTASSWKGYGNDGVSLVRIGHLNQGGQADRIYSPDGKSVNLSANGGGRGAKTGLYEINSKGKTHQQDLLQTAEGKCRTIPAGTHGSTPHLLKTIISDTIIRKLTPIECERLQSLPDNFTEGVSNTQRYKALGNAFNCEVIKHIIKLIHLLF